MTKDEFIERYCSASRITRDHFHRYKIALPCQCGEGGCMGWAAISHDYDLICDHIQFHGPGPTEWLKI